MLTVLLILSLLVFVHELGHYLVARWRGVRVEEFGIGYPPRATKLFRFKGTDFTLNWIPFGGFVKLLGEDSNPDDENKVEPSPERFDKASTFSKLSILLAGAAFNFLFGAVIFAAIFSRMGLPEHVEEARIGDVMNGSPAFEAGLPSQVTVTQIKVSEEETINISTFGELVDVVDQNRGKDVTLVTTGECNGYECAEGVNEYKMYVRTLEETPEGQGALGVIWGPAYVKYPPLEMPFRSAWYGIQQAYFLGEQILLALNDLFSDLVSTGEVPGEIAGPVGIVHQVSSSGLIERGTISILFFAGMLSVNLAVMNILPIPPLDGGRAVFVIIGSLTSHKNVAKLEYLANYTGYILLLIAIVLVTIRDVVRVIG